MKLNVAMIYRDPHRDGCPTRPDSREPDPTVAWCGASDTMLTLTLDWPHAAVPSKGDTIGVDPEDDLELDVVRVCWAADGTPTLQVPVWCADPSELPGYDLAHLHEVGFRPAWGVEVARHGPRFTMKTEQRDGRTIESVSVEPAPEGGWPS